MKNEIPKISQQVVNSMILVVLKENYLDSQNPLFAWEALKYCFENNIDVPQWVSTYFVKTATDLLNLSKRKLESSEKASAEVYKTLGMTKSGNRDIFDRYNLFLRDKKIVSRICQLDIEKYGNRDGLPTNVTIFVAKVAKELKMGESAVFKIWRKWAEPMDPTEEKLKEKLKKL